MIIKKEEAGLVLELKNESKQYMDASYASVTAPDICYVEILINDIPFDGVWVRESHSWWTNAGGKLLPIHGLPAGATLKITSSGACALRIDWNE